MFGKLLKYEIKAAGKWYVLLYLATLLFSAIFGLGMKVMFGSTYATIEYADNRPLSTLASLSLTFVMFVIFALIIALNISTFFLIINRFYKNVYGREGYLTMTLPVTSHQIILSKLTAAAIWGSLSFLTSIASFFIFLSPSFDFNQVMTELPIYIKMANNYVPLSLVFLASIVSTFSGILLTYLAISIGQLFQNRRGLMGCVAYFVIYVLLSFIVTFITPEMAYSKPFGPDHFILILITSIFEIIICYFATHYIMTKHLNIQ